MVRRGQPIEIYCDNGTNFCGADAELRREFQNIDTNAILNQFTNATTKVKFNPPAAPHMGGSWERLVRSVKTTMKAKR